MSELEGKVEDLELGMDTLLLKMDVGELYDSALACGMEEGTLKGASRSYIVKLLRKYYDHETLEERETSLVNLMSICIAKSSNKRDPLAVDHNVNLSNASNTSSIVPPDGISHTNTDLQQQITTLQSMLTKLQQSTPAKSSSTLQSSVGQSTPIKTQASGSNTTGQVAAPTVQHLIRREFKIVGNINPQGKSEKPSLSYISLCHQIEAGVKQKYSNDEVIAGVIRAMQPGMRLRTVLETLPNLELSRLRVMIRCHYSEKACAELFQGLTNCCQILDESADDYFIRVYEIRQKLVFARKENGADPNLYTDKLIKTYFSKLWT